jgi:hypothetical protein
MWKNVAYNQPTNLNYLMCPTSWFFTVENVSYIFNPISSTQRWRKSNMNLPMMNTLSQLNTKTASNCHSMERACVCLLWGLTSPEHLGRPLTSKVHWSRSSQDAGTNYSAWYDATEKLMNQTYTNWLKPSTRMAPLWANQAQSILGRVKCSVVHASVNFVYLKFFFYTSTLTWW